MSLGRQTEVRGLPLLHHTRSPLWPHLEVIFVEAASMKAIAEETSSIGFKNAFFDRIEIFVEHLRPAILTGAYIMSGYSVDHKVLQAQQDLFWHNNIKHAAAHLRARTT